MFKIGGEGACLADVDEESKNLRVRILSNKRRK
jgi:hypothetical protein